MIRILLFTFIIIFVKMHSYGQKNKKLIINDETEKLLIKIEKKKFNNILGTSIPIDAKTLVIYVKNKNIPYITTFNQFSGSFYEEKTLEVKDTLYFDNSNKKFNYFGYFFNDYEIDLIGLFGAEYEDIYNSLLYVYISDDAWRFYFINQILGVEQNFITVNLYKKIGNKITSNTYNLEIN